MSVAVVLLIVLAQATGAAAQSWWPFSQSDPRPKAPVYRAPPAPIPQEPAQQWSNRPGPSGAPVCVQLEQQLVAENARGNQTRGQLPRIEDDMRQNERIAAQMQAQLDHGNCYETFFFTRSLRRNIPQCVQAANQLDSARRHLSDLSIQRQQLQTTTTRSYQDDIIRDLARNRCGQQYVDEARKRDGGSFGSIFGGSDPEDDGSRSATSNNFGNLPFDTYRTVCVRLCDGFFFPVSFSTLPNHFNTDAEQCQSRCAAPVELYYYKNPGADIHQAMSVKSQTPYTGLKMAFRYTKEYVQGCSCKEAEYVPAAGEKRADVPGGPGQVGNPGRTAAAGPLSRVPGKLP